MRAASRRIDHLLTVSVIRRHDGCAAPSQNCIHHAPDAGINRLDGLDGGTQIAGVTDHVSVGIVEDEQIILIRCDAAEHFLGDREGGHFRFLVVRRDVPRAGNEESLLTRKGLVAIVVEEKSHVRIFLRLGASKLPQSEAGRIRAQNVDHLRRSLEGHMHRQPSLVLTHRAIIKIVDLRTSLKSLPLAGFTFDVGHEREVVENERPGQLPRPVSAEIEKDHTVARANRPHARCNGRNDELIARSTRLRGVLVIVDRSSFGRRKRLADAVGQQAIGLLHPIPPIVAVHGVVTPDNAGHRIDAALLALLLDLLDETLTGPRRRVAPISDRMNKDTVARKAKLNAHVHERIKVIECAVNLAVATQTQKVNRSAGCGSMREYLEEGRDFEEGTVPDRSRNAHLFLINNATGPDVLMADFAVAHYASGQADIFAARMNLRPGISRAKSVVDRRPRKEYSVCLVPLGVRIMAPAVADDEKERPFRNLTHAASQSDILNKERAPGANGTDIFPQFLSDIVGRTDIMQLSVFIGLVAADDLDVAGVDQAIDDALANTDIIHADQFHLIGHTAEHSPLNKQPLSREPIVHPETDHRLTNEQPEGRNSDQYPENLINRRISPGATRPIDCCKTENPPKEQGPICPPPRRPAGPYFFLE